MKSRSIGERAKILLDEIDLQILRETTIKSYGILKLSDKLKIKHKNLKPHLDKLSKARLLQVMRSADPKNPRKIMITSREQPNFDGTTRDTRTFQQILEDLNNN